MPVPSDPFLDRRLSYGSKRGSTEITLGEKRRRLPFQTRRGANHMGRRDMDDKKHPKHHKSSKYRFLGAKKRVKKKCKRSHEGGKRF